MNSVTLSPKFKIGQVVEAKRSCDPNPFFGKIGSAKCNVYWGDKNTIGVIEYQFYGSGIWFEEKSIKRVVSEL